MHAICLVVGLLLPVQANDADAKQVAQEILNKGSALFDSRDAKAMAATYMPEGQLVLYVEEKDTGEFKREERQGRSAVESGYAKLFEDRSPETKSKNTVEGAHMLGKNVMVIRGMFQLDVGSTDAVEFVQVRARQGAEWKVLSMQVFYLAK